MASQKQAEFVADLHIKVCTKQGIKNPAQSHADVAGIVLTWSHEQVQAKINELRALLGAGSGGASQAQIRLGTSLQVELSQMQVLGSETGFDFRSATPETADFEIKRLIALKRTLEAERRVQKATVTDIATKRA